MTHQIPVLYLRQSSEGGGGADTVMLDTASRLEPGRFNVIVGCLRKRHDNIGPLISKALGKGINLVDLPGGSFFDLVQFMAIARLIRLHGIKIVHCHDSKANIYGYLLGLRFKHLKLVSTLHGWIVRRPRSRFYLLLDRFVLRRFSAVIAVSRDLERTASGYGIKRICTIHNAVDTEVWRPAEQASMPSVSRGYRVGYVGRLSKEKGPLDFMLTAKKILGKYPECEFLVAGNGPEEGAVKAFVRRENMERSFRFLGHLDRSGLRDLYGRLDVLLLPSYTEGLPMTILEACAMRVPVIATKVGGVEEIIRDGYNGLLVKAGDIDAMSATALTLLGNRELARKLANNGRLVAEQKFSLEVCVKKIEEVYSQIEDIGYNPDIQQA